MPTIQYNSSKTDRHVATLVDLHGIRGIDEIGPVFERLCNGSLRATRDKVLHLALCPEPGVKNDELDEDAVRNLVADIMEGLGYGNQPWVVYRHFDIDRIHYHIVSCRIGPDGRKINDFQEHRRAQELMKALMPKYGYSRSFDTGKVVRTPVRVERFDRKKPVSDQLRSLVTQASAYAFSSREQYIAILASKGVTVRISDNGIVYSGCHRGRQCTPEIASHELGVTDLKTLDLLVAGGQERLSSEGRRSRHRITAMTRFAIKEAMSERHFAGILGKCGIGIKVSRNSDGEIFGITYIDHQSRCCWKASEVPDAVKSTDLASKYATGEWKAPEARKPSVSSRRPVRQDNSEAMRTRQQNARSAAVLDQSAAALARGIMSAAYTGKEDDELERDMDQSRREDEGMGI